MKRILPVLFCLQALASFAQTQNVRGKVMDSETNFPLAGAKVEIEVPNESGTKYRAVTDDQGAFSIASVPVGKYSLTTRVLRLKIQCPTNQIVL